MSEQLDSEMKKQTPHGKVPKLLYILVFLMVIAFCVQSIHLRNLTIQVNDIKKNPVVGIVERVINSPLKTKPAAPAMIDNTAINVPEHKTDTTEPRHFKTYVPVAVQKQKEAEQTETAQVIQAPIPEEDLNTDETKVSDTPDDSSQTSDNINGILTQEPDKYVLRFDMRGIDRNDISIKMKGNTISVSGTVKQQTKNGSGENYVIQNEYHTFNQMFSIPGDVIKSGIKSSFSKEGMLTITLPRESPARQVGPVTH